MRLYTTAVHKQYKNAYLLYNVPLILHSTVDNNAPTVTSGLAED